MKPGFWMLLGEASSKCEHLANVPLRPATAEKLHKLYLAKGAAATTAIEGNTLSESEVLQAVEGKLEVPPSKEYQKQEVDNIITLCQEIMQHLGENSLPALSAGSVQHYNRGVLKGLPSKEDVVPGEIRRHSVIVGLVYRGAPAEDCYYLVDRLCAWLNGPDFKPPPGQGVVYAIIKAILAHVYLAWIHPFGDGNGRTARMIEYHLLLEAGIPSPAAHLLSNHYNETRSEYYRQLDLASKSGGDLRPFLQYAVQGLVDGLRKQLEFVWEQQWDVVWRNYVHERFRHDQSPASRRQCDLALELGLRENWTPVSAIAELTPRLAAAYATRTPKTIQRDLNHLEELNLIVRQSRQVRARRELIFAFLPLKKQQPGA